MEATGRYHEPVAAALHEYGIHVTVRNPLFIKQSGGGSIRKVKTSKADARKIAKYAPDNWADLREYTPMEAIREQRKLSSRPYNLYMKNGNRRSYIPATRFGKGTTFFQKFPKSFEPDAPLAALI